MDKIALLDLGSNSTRMGIYQINADHSFTEIKRFKEMTRLSEGMGDGSKDLKLKPAAIKRTLEALKRFKVEYEQVPEITVRGVATAAVRNASNGADFLEQVHQQMGVEIEILSGNAEAYYDYVGVLHAFDLEDCMICDMGGGSFELIVVQGRKAVNYISIPYGAVTLSERYHATDKISAVDFFALQRFISYKFNQLSWLTKGRGFPLVLLGGANRTVARKGNHGKTLANSQGLHGTTMSAFEFIEVFQSWLGQTLAQRQQSLGDEKDRADIIIAGLTPVVMLIEQYAVPKIIFSESGVREGIIAELANK